MDRDDDRTLLICVIVAIVLLDNNRSGLATVSLEPLIVMLGDPTDLSSVNGTVDQRDGCVASLTTSALGRVKLKWEMMMVPAGMRCV